MDNLVERVTKKIAEAIHPDKLILFSSRAEGAATEESDIDLVVVYSGQKSTREIEIEIQRLFMPRDFSMDVFVMRPQELETRRKYVHTIAPEVSEHGAIC